jgi:radical SAM protein with 4Fe4S-binding SPASM domain
MEYDLFTKIIDDISEFESNVHSLRLYNVGEPLLNKRLPEMIRYAKQSGRINIIDTTTNCSLLTPEISLELIDAGLDKICFSIEALTSKEYLKIAGAKVDFDKVVSNIAFFFEHSRQCQVHVKIMDVSVPTDEDKQKFYRLFEDKCHTMWVDSVVNVWPDFDAPGALSGKNMYNEEVIPLLVCTQPFYNLSVNPDGTVTHCDLDWNNEFIIGDLTKQTLKEIWNSDIVYHTQLIHLKGDRKTIEICRKCPWPDNGCIDNFDEYRETVLKRFMELNLKGDSR